MPGASDATRRVTILNANWVADPDGGDGKFELMIVTEDDEKHAVPASPAAVSTVLALTQADAVLAWDRDNRTLIAANIVGTMRWTTEASPDQQAQRDECGTRS